MDDLIKAQYETPTVHIEGKPYRSNTISPLSENYVSDAASSSDGLPNILPDDYTSLNELLREHGIDVTDGRNGRFWPQKLLRHILSRDRVSAVLESYNSLGNTEIHIDCISQYDDHEPSKGRLSYLKIFAILLLCERGDEIANFVKEKVSDESLPLIEIEGAKNRGRVNLYRQHGSDRPLECFQKWKACERDSFRRYQWEFLVPYFELDGYTAKSFKLQDEIILPWLRKQDHSHSSSEPSGEVGGYAFVSCVKMHPCSHGFHKVLHAIRLTDNRFALKMLHDRAFNDEALFRNEMDQLNRFNGMAHDHLVTLLATFTHQRKYYFLFPYADGGTLEQYWDAQSPLRDLDTVRWLSKQCSGIMAATDTIHAPKHLTDLAVPKFGRHGDIKADNILWFQSSNDPKGILVISDMGLSSFNSDKSRSNIPNTRILGRPPGYRPPECDLEGGTISRAFDIWTLGCLYLELLTWLVGGSELLQSFQSKRLSEYSLTGANNDIFYDLKEIKGQAGYVAQVKPQVTKWFDVLHNHVNVTDFIHAILDIIKEEMIIVLAEGQMRSSSDKLRSEFEKIYSQCMDDNDTDYCLKSTPRPLPPFRAATAVEANLNEAARLTVIERQPSLPIHEGRIRKSMRSEQLANLDHNWPIFAEPEEQD